MNTDKRIDALYIRVSTDAQFEEGYSVDAQKEILANYCKALGYDNYAYYVDGGFTGSNIHRPQMQKIIQECNEGKIRRIIVYKLDRLSRSQKDTLYLIEDVFIKNDVSFVSINESFDTNTPFGKAMIGILSVFAQLERENIYMRTRMGMKERVKSGLWMGGGRVPFGYDYDKNKGIIVPNEDAQTVKKMYALYLKGYSQDKIAKILGLKYDRLVTQVLQRKSNTGCICYKGEEYPGQHEAIIDLDTYQKVCSMMAERAVKKTASSNYLLTGLVYCGVCGAKMRYQKWGKSGVKLVCYSQQSSKQYLIKDRNCDNEKVWADDVESYVIRDLFKLSIRCSQEETDQRNTPINVINELKLRQETVAGKIKKLYNLYAEAEDDLLLDAIEENQAELANIKKQIEQENACRYYSEKAYQTQKTVASLSDIWDYATPQEKQGIIRDCVDKVLVKYNAVDVYYTFV